MWFSAAWKQSQFEAVAELMSVSVGQNLFLVFLLLSSEIFLIDPFDVGRMSGLTFQLSLCPKVFLGPLFRDIMIGLSQMSQGVGKHQFA